MDKICFSVKERMTLLEVLCGRRDFVGKLISDLDLRNEDKLLKLYRDDLESINSILSKLGYF